MGKNSFKKASAMAIRCLVMSGERILIDIGHNDWCAIVSSKLYPSNTMGQPMNVLFQMAGGNRPQLSTAQYEYRYKTE